LRLALGKAGCQARLPVCCCYSSLFVPVSVLCDAYFRCVGEAGWYVGEAQASCSATCNDAGLVCTEAQLQAHNDEVDTTSEIDAIIKANTGNARPGNGHLCSTQFSTGSDVPNYRSIDYDYDGSCHLSRAGRALATFDCDARGEQDDKHRLCYCHTGQSGQDFSLIGSFSRTGCKPNTFSIAASSPLAPLTLSNFLPLFLPRAVPFVSSQPQLYVLPLTTASSPINILPPCFLSPP
jgi:hypothetical protein